MRMILGLDQPTAGSATVNGRAYTGHLTVKTHVGGMFGKLGLRDRVQTVVYAYEHRLVRPQSRP
jgi:hypothetical protein